MKETGSPRTIIRELEFKSYPAYIVEGSASRGAEEAVKYNPESDLKALMLRQLEQIPYIKDWVKLLRRNLYLRRICGYGGDVPAEAHFSRMKRRIGEEGFHTIERHLRHEVIRLGLLILFRQLGLFKHQM